MKSIYLMSGLRNRKEVIKLANRIEKEIGIEVFDDWLSPGKHADDHWKEYERARGRTYKQALEGYAAQHIFAFDKFHLDRCDGCILLLPA